ncbi:hypothetical protein L3Q82_025232 [Scortum barcoo]|uniref:Uncharacterized protein n=1 Tax=Scortum barcoo TaxID=214431 RepID=A0ACB8WRW7_9TELE|nr:hypothetical protein L3Q82_025232 [Scortum barcoo]
MASSDGLEEDCVLQRGRSQSDPSSITEVRLGEAHRAGGWVGNTGARLQPITSHPILNHSESHYPQMAKTWNSDESFPGVAG